MQAPGIGWVLLDRGGAALLVAHIRRLGIGAVAPGIGGLAARTGGALPLGLGGQDSLAPCGQQPLQALQKVLHVIPTDLFYRAIGGVRAILEEAGVAAAHHRLPQRLGTGRVGQPEAAGERDGVAWAFMVFTTRLIGGRAHQEASGFDVAQALCGLGQMQVKQQAGCVGAKPELPVRQGGSRLLQAAAGHRPGQPFGAAPGRQEAGRQAPGRALPGLRPRRPRQALQQHPLGAQADLQGRVSTSQVHQFRGQHGDRQPA